MVRAAALMLALVAVPPGPAIMVIKRTNGTDYIPFSSYARCEAARRDFERDQQRTAENVKEQGYHYVEGTQPVYRCIPG